MRVRRFLFCFFKFSIFFTHESQKRHSFVKKAKNRHIIMVQFFFDSLVKKKKLNKEQTRNSSFFFLIWPLVNFKFRRHVLFSVSLILNRKFVFKMFFCCATHSRRICESLWPAEFFKVDFRFF
jgi:hypothetical protein